MSKVRVHELAKRYGRKGPEFAKLLKELGFEGVKSHMSSVDDATELQIVARLEAQGLRATPAPEQPEDEGLPKKKSLPDSGPRKKSLPPPIDGPKKKPLPTVTRATKTNMGATTEAEPEPVEPAAESVSTPMPKKKPLPQADDVGAATAAEPEPAPQPKPAAATEQTTTPKPVTEAPKPAAEAPKPATSQPVGEQKPTEPEPTAEPAAQKPAAQPAAQQPAAQPAAQKPAPAQSDESNGASAAPTPQRPTPKETPARPAATRQPPVPQRPAPGAGPSVQRPAATTGASAQARGNTPATGAEKSVKKLIVPQAKAKVIGRIELPQEVTRDAQRRSSPGGGRNPGGVDRGLRSRALQSTQSRGAQRSGPFGRRGPGGRRNDGPRGRGQKKRTGAVISTVDPNKIIEIEPPISVKGLSEAVGVKVNDLITALTFELDVPGKTINSFLEPEEVELVAEAVNRKIKIVERREAEDELIGAMQVVAETQTLLKRAPVVTFMGHVDHGKTSLLDALRASDVVKGEAGGITQHVGAYKVTPKNANPFVVLDTPGHEAFTAMRVRGAKITDVVVLVVAADDGVMPQTEEAISHIKNAGVEKIVAINKCDKPGANPMQVKQQLAVKGLQPEEWGGDTQMIEVSALTGEGLDNLVEAIHLVSDISELEARPEAAGVGIVIESKQSPEQGVVVNVLITDGTLRVRDQVLCGESLSRVRSLIDDHGRDLKEAGPSTPVSLLGLASLPLPGDKLFVVNDKRKAKEVAEERQTRARNLSLAERSKKVTADNVAATLAQLQMEEIKIILKADVMGSLEPIRTSLGRLATEEVRVNIIHSALGGITETDVNLAAAGGAMIVGFNTVPDNPARQAADRQNVEIRQYSIIYELVDDMKLAMEGALKPEEQEEVTGHAEIRAIFRSSKLGAIAGCYITDGLGRRSSKARLVRDGRVVYTGELQSLRREKDDVREIKAGYECGITLKDYQDIKQGDVIEFYDVKLVKRTLA